jgi:hypothetical protein
MNEMEGWEIPSAITTEDLDAAVGKLTELEKIYDEKKKAYVEADAAYETHRRYLLGLLQATGKSKYHVDGLGTISLAIKTTVTVPKDPVSKKAMIEYFQSLGPELFRSYITVNSQTLNSYVNEQCQIDPDFIMPGAGPKTEKPELRFRRDAKGGLNVQG